MMSTKEVAVMSDAPDEVQRWTAKRKAAVVMSIVKGETSAAEAARKHGLSMADIERGALLLRELEAGLAPGLIPLLLLLELPCR
jgi:transposase-like protein